MRDKNQNYKQYVKSLADYTLGKMKKERENKLLNPHLLQNRDEVERELEIINEVLEGR